MAFERLPSDVRPPQTPREISAEQLQTFDGDKLTARANKKWFFFNHLVVRGKGDAKVVVIEKLSEHPLDYFWHACQAACGYGPAHLKEINHVLKPIMREDGRIAGAFKRVVEGKTQIDRNSSPKDVIAVVNRALVGIYDPKLAVDILKDSSPADPGERSIQLRAIMSQLDIADLSRDEKKEFFQETFSLLQASRQSGKHDDAAVYKEIACAFLNRLLNGGRSRIDRIEQLFPFSYNIIRIWKLHDANEVPSDSFNQITNRILSSLFFSDNKEDKENVINIASAIKYPLNQVLDQDSRPNMLSYCSNILNMRDFGHEDAVVSIYFKLALQGNQNLRNETVRNQLLLGYPRVAIAILKRSLEAADSDHGRRRVLVDLLQYENMMQTFQNEKTFSAGDKGPRFFDCVIDLIATPFVSDRDVEIYFQIAQTYLTDLKHSQPELQAWQSKIQGEIGGDRRQNDSFASHALQNLAREIETRIGDWT